MKKHLSSDKRCNILFSGIHDLLFCSYTHYKEERRNSSDGRVVRASASAVDLGLIPSRVPAYCVENNPASLLDVPLGKTLSGIPPSWCAVGKDT